MVLIVKPTSPDVAGGDGRRPLPTFLDWIAKDCRQFVPAGNILAPHTHDARAACQRPRGDLIDDAIRLCVVLFDKGDGTNFVIDKSGNGRVDIHEQSLDAAEGGCSRCIGYVGRRAAFTCASVK